MREKIIVRHPFGYQKDIVFYLFISVFSIYMAFGSIAFLMTLGAGGAALKFTTMITLMTFSCVGFLCLVRCMHIYYSQIIMTDSAIFEVLVLNSAKKKIKFSDIQSFRIVPPGRWHFMERLEVNLKNGKTKTILYSSPDLNAEFLDHMIARDVAQLPSAA